MCQIEVYARLLILRKKLTLHGLILVYIAIRLLILKKLPPKFIGLYYFSML